MHLCFTGFVNLVEYNHLFQDIIIMNCPCYESYRNDFFNVIFTQRQCYFCCIALKLDDSVDGPKVNIFHESFPILLGSRIDLMIRSDRFVFPGEQEMYGCCLIDGLPKLINFFTTNNLRSGHLYRIPLNSARKVKAPMTERPLDPESMSTSTSVVSDPGITDTCKVDINESDDVDVDEDDDEEDNDVHEVDIDNDDGPLIGKETSLSPDDSHTTVDIETCTSDTAQIDGEGECDLEPPRKRKKGNPPSLSSINEQTAHDVHVNNADLEEDMHAVLDYVRDNSNFLTDESSSLTHIPRQMMASPRPTDNECTNEIKKKMDAHDKQKYFTQYNMNVVTPEGNKLSIVYTKEFGIKTRYHSIVNGGLATPSESRESSIQSGQEVSSWIDIVNKASIMKSHPQTESSYEMYFKTIIDNGPKLDELSNKTIISPCVLLKRVIQCYIDHPKRISQLKSIFRSGNLYFALSNKANITVHHAFKCMYNVPEGQKLGIMGHLLSNIKRHVTKQTRNSTALCIRDDYVYFTCPINTKEINGAGEIITLANMTFANPKTPIPYVRECLELLHKDKRLAFGQQLIVVWDSYLTNFRLYNNIHTFLTLKYMVPFVHVMIFDNKYILISSKGRVHMKYSSMYRIYLTSFEAKYIMPNVFAAESPLYMYSSTIFHFPRSIPRAQPAKIVVGVSNIKGACHVITSPMSLLAFLYSLGNNEALLHMDQEMRDWYNLPIYKRNFATYFKNNPNVLPLTLNAGAFTNPHEYIQCPMAVKIFKEPHLMYMKFAQDPNPLPMPSVVKEFFRIVSSILEEIGKCDHSGEQLGLCYNDLIDNFDEHFAGIRDTFLKWMPYKEQILCDTTRVVDTKTKKHTTKTSHNQTDPINSHHGNRGRPKNRVVVNSGPSMHSVTKGTVDGCSEMRSEQASTTMNIVNCSRTTKRNSQISGITQGSRIRGSSSGTDGNHKTASHAGTQMNLHTEPTSYTADYLNQINVPGDSPFCSQLVLYCAIADQRGSTNDDGFMIDSTLVENGPLKLCSYTVNIKFNIKTPNTKSVCGDTNIIKYHPTHMTNEDATTHAIVIGHVVSSIPLDVHRSKNITVTMTRVNNHYRYAVSYSEYSTHPKWIHSHYNVNTNVLTFNVQYTCRLGVGTKLANLHGQKGIVSAVQDLRRYGGYTKDGRYIWPQVYINPISPVSRTVASQIFEAIVNPDMAINEYGTVISAMSFNVHHIQPSIKSKPNTPKIDLMTSENGFVANKMAHTLQLLFSQNRSNNPSAAFHFIQQLFKIIGVHIKLLQPTSPLHAQIKPTKSE